MTNEEAIKIIEVARAEVEWEYPMEYAAAFDKAIEALEKQIPKKPVNIKRKYGKMTICPDCGTEHDRDVNAAKNILILGLQLL